MKQIGVIISIIFLLVACNGKKENESKHDKKNTNILNLGTIYMQGDSIMQFAFALPDTVYQNRLYDAKIVYQGILDSVNTKLATKDGMSRYILYYMTQTNSIDYDDEYLMSNMKLDTIGAVSNDTINLYDLQFKELGIHYIDGILEDEVYIELKDNPEKTRVITKRIRATHRVFVVKDTINISNNQYQKTLIKLKA